MLIEEMLVKELTSFDNNRERSQQKELGVSSIGGCRRSVYHTLRGDMKTNPILKLPGLMGTAIHKMIEESLVWSDYELELEVEYDGLKGHLDCYIEEAGAVIDWKTVKMKSLKDFPNEQQIWQVQLYGYLLAKNNRNVKTVSLVAIPRDGDERDIKVYTENYDEAIALVALQWLAEVKELTEPPAPEKFVRFCKLYCGYYGSECFGK